MTSLLKCTLKKSLDVTKKLVLYAAIVIDALAALWLAGYGVIGLTAALAAPIAAIITATWVAIGIVIAFLFAIPWYVYAGLLVVAGIVGYSFAWCIARELTEEDWDAGYRGNWQFIALGGIVIMAAYLILNAPSDMSTFRFENVVTGIIGAILGISSAVVLLAIGAFMDAFIHYRKRVRGDQ